MTTNQVTPTAGDQAFLDTLVGRIADFHSDQICIIEMAGIKEIAQFLNVQPSTVCNWSYRRFDNLFPEPVKKLGATPVYSIVEVVHWYIQWMPRSGKKIGTLPETDELTQWLYN